MTVSFSPTTINNFCHDDSGQALVEYALILMLVALVAIGALTSIGTTVAQLILQAANGF